MPEFQVPTKNKKFIQANKSDIFGNLFSTFNMDFDVNEGKIRVSPRLRINTDSTDDADLGTPWAFVRSSADTTDRWWAGCGAVLFKSASSDPSSAFTQDAIANTPTGLSVDYADLVEFNGALIVSFSQNISRLASGTWTASWWQGTLAQAALVASVPHPLHVTEKTKVLLIGDDNKVHRVDNSSNVSNGRLVFESKYRVMWIRSSPDGTWIGLINKIDGEGQVAFWDESDENYNRLYGIKSDRSFAGVVKDGIIYTVNSSGQLLKFTGAGFDEVAVFPIYKQIAKRLASGSGAGIGEAIKINGMAVIDGIIHISINPNINGSGTDADLIVNFPAGIWTFDERQGLRHKYSFSQYDGSEIDYGAFSTGSGNGGAIIPTNPEQGLFLAGCRIFTNASSTIAAIFYRDKNDSIVKRGHFTTSVFESSLFEDIFKDLLLTFKRFRSSSDRIVVKYRSVKNINFPIISILGTWTDTDTFTSTGDLSNVAAGDEIEIIRGRGAGALVHVDSISEAGGTYTVNLKETIVNASGTIRFNVNNFKECARITSQNIERQEFDLDIPGTFIQLKVELRSASGSAGAGDSPELELLRMRSSSDEVI